MKKAEKKRKRIILPILLSLAAILLLLALFSRKAAEHMYPLKYTDYVNKYSAQYNVPKDLIYATIAVESGYDEKAKSDVGALGLTQIMPDTLMWLEKKTGESYTAEDLYNPEVSIKYCAYLYSILLEKYGSRNEAVCAYHAGINQVAVWLGNGEYSSDGKTLDRIPSKATGHYLNKVINAINIYNKLYEKEFENE